jgi:hypothetical protein
VNEQELEQALRRALRPADPGDDFCDRVIARVEASAAKRPEVVSGVLAPRRSARDMAARWGSVALAACVIAGVGLAHWRQQALERQRGLEARAELLQALSITSANLSVVRDAVAREEEPVR